MSTINRPIAGNRNTVEKMRNTLSGKADSVFSYRSLNPYSMAYDKFRKDENANFSEELWQQAANKGELDQYINLLAQNKNRSGKLDELTELSGGNIDYDTTMLALAYDVVDDEQRALLDKVFNHEAEKWEAILIEEEKASRNFFQKGKTVLAESGAFVIGLATGATRVFNDAGALTTGVFKTLVEIVTNPTILNDEEFSKLLVQNIASDQASDIYMDARFKTNDTPMETLDQVEEQLAELSWDLKRKYSTSIDATTGEQKFWGQVLHGMADSIGYMSLALMGGGPAAMYLPMFARNIRENTELMGYNTNYTKLLTNAGIKTGIEFAIEWSLGKLVGFSGLDKALGFSDDVLKIGHQTVVRGLTTTTKQAVIQVAKRTAKDMLKEGIEESLQEASGMFIDYLYGGQYADRSKENFTKETFAQAFIVGAATSFAIGTFVNMKTQRAYGVDQAGLTYKMGKFQSISYQQAVSTMMGWQKIATDQKANPMNRLTATLQLQGVVATLGNVYKSLGVESAVKADQLLNDVQNYHTRKTTIKDKVNKGTYITDMITNMSNEVGGANWASSVDAVTFASNNMLTDMLHKKEGVKAQHKKANKSVAYESFTRTMLNKDVQALMAAAGITSVTPVDLTNPANIKADTTLELAKDLGFNVVVRSDGKDLIQDGDVVILPETLSDADTQGLLKEIATQTTINTILKNMPAALVDAVTDTFTKALGTAANQFTIEQIAIKATAALMFDKNFQLKMLLQTKQNSNTWGTDQVIEFITNLKKHVKKIYEPSPAQANVEQITEVKQSQLKLGDVVKKNVSIDNKTVTVNATIVGYQRNKSGALITLKYETGQEVNNQIYFTEAMTKNSELDKLSWQVVTTQATTQGARKLSIVPFPNGNKINYTGSEGSARAYVVVDFNGVQLPFYLSSGQVTKKGVVPGKWYPVFGVDQGNHWIKKGSSDLIAKYYNQPLLKEAAEYLDTTVGDVRPKIEAEAAKQTTGEFEWSAKDLEFFNEGLNKTDSSPFDPATLTEADVLPIVNRVKEIRKKLTAEKAQSKPKRVLSDISKVITQRVVASLQDTMVIFNTTVKRSATYDPATSDVIVDEKLQLDKEHKEKISSNPSVRYSAIIEALANNKLKITPEVDLVITKVASDLIDAGNLTKFISAIMERGPKDALPSKDALKSKILKTIANGTINQRAELVALLTYHLSKSEYLAKQKIHFIPLDSSNLNEHVGAIEAKASLEAELLGGQTIVDVINGDADISQISRQVTEIADDFGTNEISRLYVLNMMMKNTTGNRYAILQNGQLAKTVDSSEDVADVIVKAVEGNTLFKAIEELRKNKKDNKLVLQDFFKTKLPKRIANMPMLITYRNTLTGYHMQDAILNVDFSSEASDTVNFTILLHEMIHAVNGTTYTKDSQIKQGGGINDLALMLNTTSYGINPTINQDLTKYIIDNFPILARLYNLEKVDKTGNYASKQLEADLGEILYILVYEETTARSVKELYYFSSLGFTYTLNGDLISLVSPDGKVKFPLKVEAVDTPTDVSTTKSEFASFDIDNPMADKYIQQLGQATTVQDMVDIAAEWLVGALPIAEAAVVDFNIHIEQIINDILTSEVIANWGDVNENFLKTLIYSFSKPALLDINMLSPKTFNLDTLNKVVRGLELKLYKMNTTKLVLSPDKTANGIIINEVMQGLENRILYPLKSLQQAKRAQLLLSKTDKATTEPVVSPSEGPAPRSFKLGQYSFVKHTGKSFMLTKQLDNGKYVTQEVDNTTLLPTRNGQQPLINDAKIRNSLLDIIANRTQDAKTKPTEPKLPEPPKKTVPTKPEKATVFEWGPWVVKEHDDKHFLVIKNVDTNDAGYNKTQIVSKKTLLPDTMFGGEGKPILSPSERNNLLDWIANESGPMIFKNKDKITGKDKYTYVPNLSGNKSTENAEKISKSDFHKAVTDYNHPLFQHLPGNVSPDYSDGIAFARAVATFYKTYPALRVWVEGDVVKDSTVEAMARKSKPDAMMLLYEEVYQKTYNRQGTLKDFMETPMHIVRSMDTNQMTEANLNSASLGYDLSMVPVFEGGEYVYYTTILPTDPNLITYLPLSYAEGLVTSKAFDGIKPMPLAEFKKLQAQDTKLSEPAVSEFAAPKFDSAGVKLTKAQSEFFKDSVVRDENGNLLRLYHGTTAPVDFDTFKHTQTANQKIYGTAFYFTPSLATAERYAESGRRNNDGPTPRANGKIIPVYLNITKPVQFQSYRRLHAAVRKVLKLDTEFFPTTKQIDEYINRLRETKGYDGIIATHYDALQYGVFDSNQIKSILNDNPTTEPAINQFAAPKPANRSYISNAQAKKSNLKYFIEKGKPIQMHSDVAAFVEGTTTDFTKLSKFFQNKILNGKLTRHDVAEYVATAKTINEYTWQALARFIYHNELLAMMGPNMSKFFLDRDTLETYAIIARLTEDADSLSKVHTPREFKLLENEFKAKLQNDPEFAKKYDKVRKSVQAWWEYDNMGKLQKRDDIIIDEKQLLPIFMRHFDGTLSGLNNIFVLAKVLAGKQLTPELLGNTAGGIDSTGKVAKISSGNAAIDNNTAGVKTQGSKVFKWIDNLRQNVIDYEAAEYATEFNQETKTFDQLSLEDKINLIYDYLYEQEMSDLKSPNAQDEYLADKDITEALDNMSEVEIDKTAMFILDSARNAVVIKEPAISDTTGIARKTIKDGLRNKLRTLIRRLAGLKVNYNKLSPEVQALINFSLNNSTMNVEAYTNLSDVELIDLSDKVAAEIETLKTAQQKAAELEKTKATIIRKVEALQKKEQALREKEAKVKARERAMKEGKTLKARLGFIYDTEVANQTFTITGPSEINATLQTILNHTWDKTTTSKVKYMDDSVQTIQNIHTATEFYKAHAAELSAWTLTEVEDVTDWLINAHINSNDSVAKQTFEATRFFILSFIYNETSAGTGIFNGMNANLKTELANYLKSVQTSAGTLLSLVKQVKDKLNPASVIISELFNRFEYKVSEENEAALDQAFRSGDTARLAETLQRIKMEAMQHVVKQKVPATRKIAAIRSMSMISGPMTWVRNIISNAALSNLNRVSTKIGNAIFPTLTAKTEATPIQYKLDQNVTPEIQNFIAEQFIDSGLFDQTISQLNKYNPSQIMRHKKTDSTDIITDMLIHSIYNEFYSESMFDSKILNTSHKFLMRMLSDRKWVRAATIRYVGKILAETNLHIDATGQIKTNVDTEIMKVMGSAFAYAARDYMHSDNFFSSTERWLSENSQLGWAGYKTIMPFATASWNWFKGAMRYSPVGLGQAIVRLATLEQQIIKAEYNWQKGKAQVAPEFTSALVRRDLGSGIIGTIAFGFGAILSALGYISLEDDDWGIPKLVIGNLKIDIKAIFGSSSVLAGAALIESLKTKNLAESLDAMLDPLLEGFFFTELLQMDANSPQGWFEWSMYQLQSIALSFIPSMARYLSGMTYTGRYRTNTLFERAVVRLPFMGAAFNVPKRTDVYTGESDGTFWDIVHRAIPYFEVITKSQVQTTTEMYGLNKQELNGTYRINGEPFKVSSEERERINQLYGNLNANALTAFYADQTRYRVLNDNNKYVEKYYSQMSNREITNALDQIFSKNSEIAKASAWLAAGNKYYTTDRELFNLLRQLGYTEVYLGNKGFVN